MLNSLLNKAKDAWKTFKTAKYYSMADFVISQGFNVSALDEDKEKYKDTFDDYITKPIKVEELKQKIRKYLVYSEI